MDQSADSARNDVKNVGRGLLMGAADIVPGVSGGTMALILGIYERLVGAISHIDFECLGLAREGRFAEGRLDTQTFVFWPPWSRGSESEWSASRVSCTTSLSTRWAPPLAPSLV